MEVCKECRKTCKFILCHLKKSMKCQEGYDMQSLIQVAKKAKKERRRERYQSNPEPEKDKRNKRYQANPEPEKDKRKKRYQANPEPEKEREREHYQNNPEPKKEKERDKYLNDPEPKMEKERDKYQNDPEPKREKERDKYLNNPEPKKQNNKAYHQQNRDIILPKMRQYNKLYKPRRVAINKCKKRIFEEQNHHHGQFHQYLLDSALNMYHHTLGKCDLKTILNAKHRIMKLKEKCPYCEENLYKIISINKLYCMNAKCRKAICSKC
jgi:hypothetical protein